MILLGYDIENVMATLSFSLLFPSVYHITRAHVLNQYPFRTGKVISSHETPYCVPSPHTVYELGRIIITQMTVAPTKCESTV